MYVPKSIIRTFNSQDQNPLLRDFIGERERANLVVRSSGFLYIRRRRTSCKCACAAFYALLFIRNYFLIFTHFHRRCLAIWADRSSQRENSPHAVLLTCSPFCRCTIRMQRRQVDLSCFTKGKLCAADGTLCSPNIAGKSQLSRSRSPTLFNISTSNHHNWRAGAS